MTYLMIHGISLEVKNVYKLYFAILRELRELRGENHFMFRLVRVRDYHVASLLTKTRENE